jgi:hypothetical protein
MDAECVSCGHTYYLHSEDGCVQHDMEKRTRCDCVTYVAPPPTSPLIPKWQELLLIASLAIAGVWIYGSYAYGLITLILPHIGWLFWFVVVGVVILALGLLLLALLQSTVLSVVRALGRAWRGEY